MTTTKSWSDHDRRAPKTPWGPAQTADVIKRGVTFVTTAGHGGLRVSVGVARKALSAAAVRCAEFWGGYYWFEEDCAVNIPFYEHPEWAAGSTPEQLKTAIESYNPSYFKLVEQGVKHPEPGDKLVVKRAISFNNGRTVNGTLTLRSAERGKLVVVDDTGFEFGLPPWFVSTGQVEWAC